MKVISRMLEAGLIDEWKLRTWIRMKAESQHESIELVNRKTAEALRLDDLQGAFFLFVLFVSVSIIAFVIEVSGKLLNGQSDLRTGAVSRNSLPQDNQEFSMMSPKDSKINAWVT